MAVKKTAANTTESVTEPMQVVYVGPNIPNMGLYKHQIYLGGYPLEVEALEDSKKAMLKRLFVKPAELAAAMNEVRTPGTALCTLADKALELRVKGE